MASDIGTGLVALAGVVIGGGFTLGAQAAGDRRTRGREAWAVHLQTLAAVRLVAMDLDRSLVRLKRMDDGDPRGHVELPRGAWIAHRAMLAPQLEVSTLTSLVDAYNEIIEWNEILWAAFASKAPDTFHKSDQHQLAPDTAAAMLRENRKRLDASIMAAVRRVRDDLRTRSQLTEGDVKRQARALY